MVIGCLMKSVRQIYAYDGVERGGKREDLSAIDVRKYEGVVAIHHDKCDSQNRHLRSKDDNQQEGAAQCGKGIAT